MEDSVTPPPPPSVATPPISKPIPPTPVAPPVEPATPPPPVPAKSSQPPLTSSPAPMMVGNAKSSPVKKILGIVVILLLLAVIGLGVYRFISSRQPSGPKIITYWGLWESEAIMKPLFEEFQKNNPNIQVDYKMQSLKEYRERLSSALSQEKGPDIFRIHSSWVPMFRTNLAPVPDSVLPQAEFDTTFYPSAKNILRQGSNYLGVPLEYDGLMMYVNNDLLTSSGLSVPKNWDELRIAALSMSRCVTETGACTPGAQISVSGVSLGTTTNVDHWQDVIGVLLLQNSVKLEAPDGQAASDVFAFYSNFARSYGIWNSDMPSSTTAFASNKVGIYFAPSWRVFDIKAINPQLNFSVHPIPQLPYDPSRNETPVTWSTFWIESVNAKSVVSKESWELVKFLASKEGQVQMFNSAKSNGRDFGEPYSRTDLASELESDQYLSELIKEAPQSKSWYLASSTADGANGLNTQLSTAFAKPINDPRYSSAELSTEVGGILAKYGLTGVGAR